MVYAKNSSLELTVGSTTPFIIEVLNSADELESLTLADHATFTVKEKSDSITNIIELTILANNLIIEDGVFVGTLTEVQADALPEGEYIGQLFIRFGDNDDLWKNTELFNVSISKPFANKIDS